MSKSLCCTPCCCNNGVLHRRVDYYMASGNLLLSDCSDGGSTRTATTIIKYDGFKLTDWWDWKNKA